MRYQCSILLVHKILCIILRTIQYASIMLLTKSIFLVVSGCFPLIIYCAVFLMTDSPLQLWPEVNLTHLHTLPGLMFATGSESVMTGRKARRGADHRRRKVCIGCASRSANTPSQIANLHPERAENGHHGRKAHGHHKLQTCIVDVHTVLWGTQSSHCKETYHIQKWMEEFFGSSTCMCTTWIKIQRNFD